MKLTTSQVCPGLLNSKQMLCGVFYISPTSSLRAKRGNPALLLTRSRLPRFARNDECLFIVRKKKLAKLELDSLRCAQFAV